MVTVDKAGVELQKQVTDLEHAFAELDVAILQEKLRMQKVLGRKEKTSF